MSEKWKDIGTLLLEYRLIKEGDIKEGMKLQKETGVRLGEALVQLGKVTMEDIDWVLSKQLDIPYVIVEDITPEAELLWKFPREFLIETRILPLYETEDQISIVTEDPFNETAFEFIKVKFSKKISISTGSGSKIEDILKNAFNKTVFPDLVSSIEGIIEKIRETSFYRIDFLLGENSCSIHVFGFGILKYMQTMNGNFTSGDIFRAFDNLNIYFLYEESVTSNRTFVAISPMLNKRDISAFPAIAGKYGLFFPDDVVFSDADSHGLTHFFHLDTPLPGYKYFSTKTDVYGFESSVYVIDAAPKEFKDYYVDIYVPEKCPSCNGSGCELCKDLGYTFKEVEGVYSSDDLNKIMKEG